MDKILLNRINASLSIVLKNDTQTNYGDWQHRAHNELSKLLTSEQNISAMKIKRFIGDNIYISDAPSAIVKGFSRDAKWFLWLMKLLCIITGHKRGAVKEAKLTFHILEKSGAIELLKYYPMPKTGQPFMVNFRGCSFTNRYLRHIYFLFIFKKYLMSKITNSAIIMDIGASYGLFSYLIKKEMPNSHHILVDIAGQLILAHYYLQTEFPNAKIASIADINSQNVIDEAFIKSYDFILIPATMYHKLKIKTVDVVTNFVSLIEMPKKWFDIYVNSEPFMSAQYFYSVNRYDSYPTYKTDITIFDFPLHRYEKIFFRTLPILRHYYPPLAFFLTRKKRYPSDLFYFIGSNKFR